MGTSSPTFVMPLAHPSAERPHTGRRPCALDGVGALRKPPRGSLPTMRHVRIQSQLGAPRLASRTLARISHSTNRDRRVADGGAWSVAS